MAAQEAAVLLVPQGNYLGALDVLAELQAALDSGLLHGLTAFWDLPAQLAHFRQVGPPSGCCCCRAVPVVAGGQYTDRQAG